MWELTLRRPFVNAPRSPTALQACTKLSMLCFKGDSFNMQPPFPATFDTSTAAADVNNVSTLVGVPGSGHTGATGQGSLGRIIDSSDQLQSLPRLIALKLMSLELERKASAAKLLQQLWDLTNLRSLHMVLYRHVHGVELLSRFKSIWWVAAAEPLLSWSGFQDRYGI
jgi:hypothetical protein